MSERMIDVEEAQAIVLRHVRPMGTERVPLGDALFRTLAEPVVCDIDYPPFDRSVMDGYAVRTADVERVPVTLRCVGQIAAGHQAERSVARGEAMQINTGAPIPIGADAVVRVEETESSFDGREVIFKKSVQPGQFITPRGTYVSKGQSVLARGLRITPLEVAVAATSGAASVTVFRRPVVAVLVTGDELIDVDQVPQGAEIRNSNQHLLHALIQSARAEAVVLGVAGDDTEAIRSKVLEGLRADVLCITGGVSAGAFDLVPGVLEDCGIQWHIERMVIKPGRPILFGTSAAGTPVFALPGNPISAFVAFELLLRPVLAALEGRPGEVPQAISARLRGHVQATTDRRSFWPARVNVTEDGQWEAESLSWHGSGDVFGMARANGLIVRPRRSMEANDGERVSVYLLDRI